MVLPLILYIISSHVRIFAPSNVRADCLGGLLTYSVKGRSCTLRHLVYCRHNFHAIRKLMDLTRTTLYAEIEAPCTQNCSYVTSTYYFPTALTVMLIQVQVFSEENKSFLICQFEIKWASGASILCEWALILAVYFVETEEMILLLLQLHEWGWQPPPGFITTAIDQLQLGCFPAVSS